MRRMIAVKKLWNEDNGAVIATEYLFVVTILVIGLVVGLAGLRAAINAELTELANAILALSQGYTVNGSTGTAGSTDGSQAIDTPGFIDGATSTAPAAPSTIDVPVQ